MKEKLLLIRDNKFFNIIVISIIILSASSVGVKTYPVDENIILLNTLNALDYLVTIIFLTEIIIRMGAENKLSNFFRKGWNNFDFVIVTVSLIPLDNSEIVLLGRLLRVFRVMRLITFIPEFRKIIENE